MCNFPGHSTTIKKKIKGKVGKINFWKPVTQNILKNIFFLWN